MYWLLSIFLSFMLWANTTPQNQTNAQLQDSVLNQQAIHTVLYINEINDWRYKNPLQKI